MSEKFGEKTEQATPHRLREARRKGQVVKSTELGSAFNLLAMVFLFILFGHVLFEWNREMLQIFLGNYLLLPVSLTSMSSLTMDAMLSFFKITGFIFLTAVVTGLVVNYAQVGFIFTTEKMKPTLEKLNPIEGFKRIASRRAIFELVKALMKISLVGYVTYLFVNSRLEVFLSYLYISPMEFYMSFSSEVFALGLRVAVVFIILAVLDYVYQRHEHFKQMRMTKQEVKDEYKQMEGDPLIKGKLKEKQRSIANQRMMEEVPKATVVITNPTELAVALKYNAEQAAAPLLVAKGAGFIAERIRERARENDVPVVENKPVARLLYSDVEIGQEIPVELYQSVAEILALVYEVNKKK